MRWQTKRVAEQPEAMLQAGYSRPFPLGIVCAGGTPGFSIPLMMALSLNVFLTYQQVPEMILATPASWFDIPATFIAGTDLVLLGIGALIDIGSAILILAPILHGLAQAQGLDPVHFAIVMTLNPEIGYLTPPSGLNLIVAMSAFREEFWTICRCVLPFIAIMRVALLTVAVVPGISLFLLD